ncbi:MAG: DUF935 family protein [Kiritimatiellaeota bacterium]|nr:DUF935 family protein [Kiritimatiellota bacterium]
MSKHPRPDPRKNKPPAEFPHPSEGRIYRPPLSKGGGAAPFALERGPGRAYRNAAAWIEATNPLRNLTLREAQAIYDAARLGNTVRLQWLYNEIEAADPTLFICTERRGGAMADLDWTVRVKSGKASRLNGLEGLAREQEDFLLGVFGDLEDANLWEAVERLATAFFRGFAHTAPVWADGGRGVDRFELFDSWNFVRDPRTGQWYWNPEADGVLTQFATGRVVPVGPGELCSLVRARHVNYPALGIYVRAALGEKKWGMFVERYGIPPVIIIMPPETDPSRQREWMAAAEKVADGGSGALPAGSDVKYADAARAQSPFAQFIQHQQELVVLMATGGVFTSLSGPTGIGQGASGVHADTWKSIVRRDAAVIASAINRQVTDRLLDAAFPGRPHLAAFDFETESQPTADEVFATAGKAAAAGLAVDPAEVSERSGWTVRSTEVEKLKSTEVEKLKSLEVGTSQLLNSSTSQLLDSSTSRLLDSSTSRLLDSSTSRLLDSSTSRLLDSSTSQLLNSSTSRLLDSSTSRLLDSSTSRLLDSSTSQLLNSSTSRLLNSSTSRLLNRDPVAKRREPVAKRPEGGGAGKDTPRGADAAQAAMAALSEDMAPWREKAKELMEKMREVEKLKSTEVEKSKSTEVEKLKSTEVEKLKSLEVGTSQLLNSSTSQLLNALAEELDGAITAAAKKPTALEKVFEEDAARAYAGAAAPEETPPVMNGNPNREADGTFAEGGGDRTGGGRPREHETKGSSDGHGTADEGRLAADPGLNQKRGASVATGILSAGKGAEPKAMYRRDTGWIGMDYGAPGNPANEHKGGHGLSHIQAKHGKDAVRGLPGVLQQGEAYKHDKDRGKLYLIHGDKAAVLTKKRDGRLLITSYGSITEGEFKRYKSGGKYHARGEN